MALIFLTWLLVTATALVYLWRLAAARRKVRRLLLQVPRHPFLTSLARCLARGIDEDLLVGAGARSLGTLKLRYREHQDPYHNLEELLQEVGRLTRSEGNVPFEALLKATYQLSYTLDIPLNRLDPCLDLLIDAMKQHPWPSPFAKAQRIAPGDPVDLRTMLPLNFGSRVAYPLGLTIYDQQGKVLSRGRVICA
jgi:hypothetical protein